MKHLKSLLLLIFATLGTQSLHAFTLHGTSFFLARSQGTNTAQDLAGVHTQLHKHDAQKSYGITSATQSFHKSVRANRMAQALFGTDIIQISGSQVTNRGELDLLADYFGLSTMFQSTVQFKPSISNIQTTFNSYWHLEQWLPGLYSYAKLPIVWTKWGLNLDETVVNDGATTPYPANYMDEDPVVAPARSFTQAMAGGQPFGDLAEALQWCKICGSQTKVGFAELQWILGYDFIRRFNGHAGVNLRVAAPTGSRPDSEFMFEPIVGNGKHWELGVGFNGHILLWEKDGEQQLNVWTDAHISHLFKSEQRRCFDLKCDNFGSRFILLKEFDSDGNYTGRMFPGPNKLTLNTDVHIPVEFEFLFMIAYTFNHFVFDIGYNGWIRAQERANITQNFPEKTYALKGIQSVSVAPALLSNATQSQATVYGNDLADQAAVADANPPVFIYPCDIDTSSAESPLAITHKLFMHIGGSWELQKHEPFFGIGGQIEFEGINKRENRQPLKNTMSQWGIWLRGGVGF